MAGRRAFFGLMLLGMAAAFYCVAAPPSIAADNAARDRINALNKQISQLQSQGRYADAIPLAKEALALREKAFASDPLDVATSLDRLATLYDLQGLYAEAEPLYKRSLAINEKVLGSDDDEVATSLNNLAAVYAHEGRYAEAESLLKRSLAIDEKALGPDDPEVAVTLANLAEMYDEEGRYAEVEPLYKRSLAIDEKALGDNDPRVATDLNNLAGLYRNQSRYAEGEALYKHSLAINEKAFGPDHPEVARGLGNLGLLYENQGRYAEAEPLLKRSLAINEKALGVDHPEVARALNNLALIYDDQGRYAEAEPLYKRSLAIVEKALGPDHPDVAYSLNNLAALYEEQNRYADAEPLYKRCLGIYEKVFGPDHPEVAKSLGNLAGLYVEQSRYAESEPLYKRSLTIREKALGPDHPATASSLGNLAALYFRQSRYPEALDLSRRAVAILVHRIAGGDGPSASGREAERRALRGYFLMDVVIIYAAGGPTATAESFRVAQWASASSAAQAVAGMAARFAAGSDAMAAAIRERQDLDAHRQALDKTLVVALGRPPKQRDPAAEDALHTELGKVDTALDALDTRIAREFPSYAELSNPKPLELADAQALLAPDEAMLVYAVTRDATWLWALRRDRAAFYKLDIGADALAAEVTALRSRLDPTRNPDLAPFDAQRANALYQKIVAPAAEVLDGAHAVFIVPDRALQSLPFGVLVTKPPLANPEHLADHRDVAWLMRDYALTVLPSVGSLRALRQFTAAGHGSLPFVGIGDPTLNGNPTDARGVKLADLFRGRLADVAEVRALPPLPETAGELRAVAKELGAGEGDLYLAERASEPLLRQAGLDRYRIVEFATHGLLSGDLPGLAEPALVLTPPQEASPDNDGLLTASKVATLKLDADWVVLSACNTAADGAPDAEGLSGLAKAFFYAGARSIVVSHWSVASQATVKLITGAFAELRKNPAIGRAEALRRAELAMLDPQNPPEYAHPLIWAPFVLAGEGGAGR